MRDANIDGHVQSSANGGAPKEATPPASGDPVAEMGHSSRGTSDQQQQSGNTSLVPDGCSSSAPQQQLTASSLSGALCTDVQVCELDWLRGCEHLEEHSYDVVLVADVVSHAFN